jgi:hypothetical protein
MRKFILIISILTTLNVWSQNFKVTPTSHEVDLSQIPKQQLPETSHKKVPHLTFKQRDEVLNKYFWEEIKDWDELDRDLLYKSIINYEDPRLLKKYPFLKKVKVEEVRNELK